MKFATRFIVTAIGSLMAVTSASLPAQAASATSMSAATPVSTSAGNNGPTANATQPIPDGRFTLTPTLDNARGTLTLELSTADSITLSTPTDRNDLQIADSSGSTRHVDLTALDVVRKEGIRTSGWSLESAHHAVITLSALSRTASGSVAPEGVRAPSKAWFACMDEKGIDGSVSAALAACALAVEVGCVEAALPAGAIGGLSAMVAGLITCRSKY